MDRSTASAACRSVYEIRSPGAIGNGVTSVFPICGDDKPSIKSCPLLHDAACADWAHLYENTRTRSEFGRRIEATFVKSTPYATGSFLIRLAASFAWCPKPGGGSLPVAYRPNPHHEIIQFPGFADARRFAKLVRQQAGRTRHQTPFLAVCAFWRAAFRLPCHRQPPNQRPLFSRTVQSRSAGAPHPTSQASRSHGPHRDQKYDASAPSRSAAVGSALDL